MKGKILICPVLAFIIGPAAGPPALNAEDASTVLTVQIESRPALDVLFVPTPQEVVDKMLSLAEVNSTDILYDLGGGDGRVVVTAAKDRGVRRAVGVDIDPMRIRESNENARKAGVSGRVAFLEKDLFDVDFREASVMTLYLLPSVNLRLRPRLLTDLKPGSRIVSHDFDMGDWKPDKKASVLGHTIYLWVVPANVHGSWYWSIMEGGRARQYKLRLEQLFQHIESAELTVDGTLQTIRNVRLKGGQFEFTMERTRDGKKQRRIFRGSVKGHSMSGSMYEDDKKHTKWSARQDPTTAKPFDAVSDTLIHL